MHNTADKINNTVTIWNGLGGEKMRRVGEDRGAGTYILMGSSWEQLQCNALWTSLPKVNFVGSTFKLVLLIVSLN